MDIFTRCKTRLFYAICLIFFSLNIQAQQADLLLDGQMDCNVNSLCVSVQIAASSSTFEIGTSSIFMDYNPNAISFQSYTSSSFDGSDNCIANVASAWDPHAYDGTSVIGNFNLTMTLLNNTFSCPTVSTTPTEIGVLCFTVLDNTADPAINIVGSNTQFNSALTNDGTNPIPDGSFGAISGTAAFNCDPCAGLGGDSDNDGVCDANDQCPGVDDSIIGTACDDGDPCTVGETYNANCGCSGGTIPDADNDGVCDAQDVCANFDDNLIGTTCNDGDPCTVGETYDANCGCSGGTTPDADNDGICDALDVCANFDDNLIGTACNDGDPCTAGETYDANCGCSGGTVQDADNDGVCDANDVCANFDDNLIGTICNDGDPCTVGETYDNNCGCSGGTTADSDNDGVCDALDTCPNFDNNLIGSSCDDGNGCTINDVYTADCNCAGTATQDADNDGVCDAQDVCANFDDNLIGTTCNDGDPCTVGETYDANCGCSGGTTADSDNDGVCDAQDVCANFDDNLIGTACNDGDPCTVGETYDNNCGCTGGVSSDSDNDGVCDTQDVCENFDDNLIGTPCDDGNPCSTGETYDANCGCSGGTVQDSDSDGICDPLDTCPSFDNNLIGTACDDGNDCTINDVYTSNCDCAGIPTQDADNDGVCDAQDVCPNMDDNLIGTTCDDGDPCTTGETYDANCGCTGGTTTDSDNDGVCDALDNCPNFDNDLIGTPCDDSDPCTAGETYDANCGCSGGDLLDTNSNGVCDLNEQNLPEIVINEIHYNPSAGDSLEFIEIVNSSSNPVNIQGMTFSSGVTYTFSQPYTLPSASSYPQNYLVIAKDSANFSSTYGFTPYGEYSGKLSNGGETITLSDPSGATIDEISYEDNLPWDTIPDLGEYSLALLDLAYDNSLASNWKAQDQFVTPGAVNSFAQSGDADGDGVPDNLDVCPGFDDTLIGTACDDNDPCTVGETYDNNCGCSGGTLVDSNNDNICDYTQEDYSNLVINEIHYSAAGGDEEDFLEIVNSGTVPVQLKAVKIVGISYTFEQSYSLPAGAYLVLAKDVAAFNTAYGIAPDEIYTGKLSGGGETLTIEDPLGNIVDEVSYDDDLPWDTIPDLGQYSLALIDFNSDNNLAESWKAQNQFVTPGTVNTFTQPVGDSDGDGVLDDVDQCPDFDDNLLGTACDDNNDCTINDVYVDCGCAGTLLPDADNDGVCDSEDVCPNDSDNNCESYCTAAVTSSNHEFIANVKLNQIDNASVGNYGYESFNSISSTLQKGVAHNITLTPGFRNNIPYVEHWSVWIDLNKDGDFDDAGEEILSDSGTGAINSTITIPSNAINGSTIMRVGMRWGVAPESCGGYPFGEMEDYTIIIE